MKTSPNSQTDQNPAPAQPKSNPDTPNLEREALKPGGRPSGYAPERVHAICQFIRHTGLSDTSCAALAEVTAASLCRWKKKDEEVQMRLDQARARFQIPRLTQIGETRTKNGELDWRAQAWLVKFANPERYGPPSRRRKLAEVELPQDLEEAAAAETASEEAAKKCDNSFRNSPGPEWPDERDPVTANGQQSPAAETRAERVPGESAEKCDNSFRNSPSPTPLPVSGEPRLSRRERPAQLRAMRKAGCVSKP